MSATFMAWINFKRYLYELCQHDIKLTFVIKRVHPRSLVRFALGILVLCFYFDRFRPVCPNVVCFPWIVHSWLPSKVVSIVYLSVMDIHIFLFFIAKHVYSWEASQNVFSRFVINTWITYFYLCFISFKIFFFLLLSYSLLH